MSLQISWKYPLVFLHLFCCWHLYVPCSLGRYKAGATTGSVKAALFNDDVGSCPKRRALRSSDLLNIRAAAGVGTSAQEDIAKLLED